MIELNRLNTNDIDLTCIRSLKINIYFHWFLFFSIFFLCCYCCLLTCQLCFISFCHPFHWIQALECLSLKMPMAEAIEFIRLSKEEKCMNARIMVVRKPFENDGVQCTRIWKCQWRQCQSINDRIFLYHIHLINISMVLLN